MADYMERGLMCEGKRVRKKQINTLCVAVAVLTGAALLFFPLSPLCQDISFVMGEGDRLWEARGESENENMLP